MAKNGSLAKTKRISLWAAFLLPLIIGIITCILHDVYPFGEACILDVDMFHQYCPFFSELMHRLKSGTVSLYSWHVGLGADFVSLYAYYLASPFNWLLLLCPSDYIIEFMTILVLLRIALMGLSFSYYIIRHFSLDRAEGSEVPMFASAVFGCAYALSGYVAAYAWNIMWLDVLALAPIAILGVELLVKEGRPQLYYAALALSIWSNYYIAVILCIFLVAWFLITWLENRGAGLMAFVRFAAYSLLAGGTGMALILPTAATLGNTSASGAGFPDHVEWYFDICAELGRHMALTERYTGNDHWPNLYCGMFALPLLVLYALNRGISWKGKLPRFLLAGLFVAGFANNVLDFIWHGFHFPTSLPGRQSFLYIFLLLSMAYEAFLKARESRPWHYAVAAALCGAFLFMAHGHPWNGQAEMRPIVLCAVLMGFYIIAMAFLSFGGGVIRAGAYIAACCVAISEVACNYNATGLGTVSRTAYVERWDDYGELLGAVEADKERMRVPFARVEQMERKTKNDACLYGYPSATQFSSLMNIHVSRFFQKVGLEGGMNFYSISGETPLLAAMLSVRYEIADNDRESSPLRSLIASSGNSYLYANAYSLPLGYVVPEDVISAWDYQNAGDIGAQNALAWLLGAQQELMAPVASESEAGVSYFTPEEDGFYYATYGGTSLSSLRLETDDGRTRSYEKASHGYTLDLGFCHAGRQVRVANDSGETIPLSVYRMNMQAFQAAYDALSRETMNLTSFSDDRVEGNITLEHAGRLVFSIANEEGWTLLVDGREEEPQAFGDAFLSVSLSPGFHEIELRYGTPGLFPGIAASIASLLLFAGAIFWRRKRGLDEWELEGLYGLLPGGRRPPGKKGGAGKKGQAKKGKGKKGGR